MIKICPCCTWDLFRPANGDDELSISEVWEDGEEFTLVIAWRCVSACIKLLELTLDADQLLKRFVVGNWNITFRWNTRKSNGWWVMYDGKQASRHAHMQWSVEQGKPPQAMSGTRAPLCTTDCNIEWLLGSFLCGSKAKRLKSTCQDRIMSRMKASPMKVIKEEHGNNSPHPWPTKTSTLMNCHHKVNDNLFRHLA